MSFILFEHSMGSKNSHNSFTFWRVVTTGKFHNGYGNEKHIVARTIRAQNFHKYSISP